ncbi:unnamed protein product [Polarella glacialis]|uniref:Uncharacterized protein n=1 Tax=Polarella glacialis TaxID=89957 RepID=A0A813LA82_POLGL|nr:unnamed protein product [Polarella glacialis]
MACAADPACGFVTVYATGYCQMTSDCDASLPAGDASAQTFAVQRPEGSCETPKDSRAQRPQAMWCWPWEEQEASPVQSGAGGTSRGCAAAFRARAADHPAFSSVGFDASRLAPGSALAASLKDSSAAAVATGRHLEWLGLPGEAHAWSCRAAHRFGSEHGRLRCAAFEAEPWEGHPRDLRRAEAELRRIADGDSSSGSTIAAYAALAWLMSQFARAAVVEGCRVELGPRLVRCQGWEAVADAWGARKEALPSQSSVENILLALIVALGILSFSLALSGIRRVVRCLRR